VTAGLAAELGDALDIPTNPKGMDFVQQCALKTGSRTVVDTLILGQSLENSLKNSAVTFGDEVIQGLACEALGDLADPKFMTRAEALDQGLDLGDLQHVGQDIYCQTPALDELSNDMLHHRFHTNQHMGDALIEENPWLVEKVSGWSGAIDANAFKSPPPA